MWSEKKPRFRPDFFFHAAMWVGIFIPFYVMTERIISMRLICDLWTVIYSHSYFPTGSSFTAMVSFTLTLFQPLAACCMRHRSPCLCLLWCVQTEKSRSREWSVDHFDLFSTGLTDVFTHSIMDNLRRHIRMAQAYSHIKGVQQFLKHPAVAFWHTPSKNLLKHKEEVFHSFPLRS